MNRIARAGACTALVVGSTLVCSQPPGAASRGQLLYTTHCIECHDSQVHWRARKLATDWESLKLQVRHWQASALLNWSEADIVEVARHLNRTIYRFTQTADLVGRAPGG